MAGKYWRVICLLFSTAIFKIQLYSSVRKELAVAGLWGGEELLMKLQKSGSVTILETKCAFTIAASGFKTMQRIHSMDGFIFLLRWRNKEVLQLQATIKAIAFCTSHLKHLL